MAAFTYRAVDRGGKPQSGVLEAVSAVSARADLRARGLLPVAVAASRGTAGRPAGRSLLGGLRPAVGARDLTLITRQLATLIGSGVRIEDALRTVAQQSAPRVAAVLLNVRAAVLDGRSFGQALTEYPAVFSEFYRASVAAGEQSGQLDQVMRHLAAFVESRARNAQAIQLALIYPALLAAGVRRDHRPADDLRHAGHRPGLHRARRRPAAPDARPDRRQRGAALLRARRRADARRGRDRLAALAGGSRQPPARAPAAGARTASARGSCSG